MPLSFNFKTLKTNAFCMLILLLLVNNAAAALFSFVWEDADDFRVVGVVNTSTNTMFVNSWTDLGGSSWTLTSVPRDYTARDSSGGVFDVPDTWDGTIGNTWAFIPDAPESDQTWAEGTFTTTNPPQYYGWGGYENDPSGLGNGVSLASSDQTVWYSVRRPAAAITLYTDPTGPVVSGFIPEPSSYAMAAFSIFGCIAVIRFRKKREKQLNGLQQA